MVNSSIVDTPFPHTNDPEILARYIEQHPHYQELVRCAREGKPLSKDVRIWHKKAFETLTDMVIAKPDDYHGRCYVTEEIKAESKKTAAINTSANLIDVLSNFPLYIWAFRSMGEVQSFGIGLGINLLLLWGCNQTAAKAVSTKPNYFKDGGKGKLCTSAKGAIIGLILLNVVKSIVSGVGVELFNNTSALNQQRAGQVIDAHLLGLKKVADDVDNPGYLKLKAECESQKKYLSSLSPSDRRYDTTYVTIYGPYAERNKDWSSVPMENLPLCRKADRVGIQLQETVKPALDKYNFLSLERAETSNDLSLLKTHLPEIYNKNFTDEGDIQTAKIADGVVAVSMAANNFFGKLSRGEFSNLGFSLFFFSLSAITSAMSVIVTVTHAKREDILMSRNESIARERQLWLEARWHELQERNLSREKSRE